MENELYHHGILGQRWGIRRYQNKDGTLTSAGKRRLAKLDAERSKLLANDKEEPTIKKSVKDMSDDELRQLVNRKQMEKNYLELNRQIAAYNPKKVSIGKKIIKDVGSKVLAPALTDSGRNLLTQFLNKNGKQWLGLNEQPTKTKKQALQDEVAMLNLLKQRSELEKYFADIKKSK